MTQYERTAKANYEVYKRSPKRTLWDCYNSCSKAKAEAFDYCLKLMNDYDGENLRIISYNSHMFTAGFEFVDKETGVCRFMYITKSRNTAVDI